MTVVNILIAAVALGLMGLLFGLLLMGTEKVFAIPADEKRDAVRAALPGANCGACGYPGCDGCADAIACGKAPVNACPVGGKPRCGQDFRDYGQCGSSRRRSQGRQRNLPR